MLAATETSHFRWCVATSVLLLASCFSTACDRLSDSNSQVPVKDVRVDFDKRAKRGKVTAIVVTQAPGKDGVDHFAYLMMAIPKACPKPPVAITDTTPKEGATLHPGQTISMSFDCR